MAKAILTLEDSGEFGISVVLAFEPPVQNDAQLTPAQQLAFRMLASTAEPPVEQNCSKPHYAYCSAEGVIRLGDCVPEGFIGLCTGPRDAVIDVIGDTALFGENGTGETLPFIPGTHLQYTTVRNREAIARFSQRLQTLKWPGIRILEA